MHRALLGFAAIAAIAAAVSSTATARGFQGSGIPDAKSSVGTLPPSGGFGARGFDCRGMVRRDGDRRRFDRCGSGVAMDWYGGEWALYNNRSFAPDSYNDWWNDRPDRAYPAWMRRNQDCQRPWFSGNVLTC